MMKRILITGSQGFVGRQVVRSLLELKKEMTLVVRDKSVLDDYPSELVELIVSPDLFAETSEWWFFTCNGIDTIIHCAWNMQQDSRNSIEANAKCFHGTLNLAKGAVKAGVRRFVGIGTCAEYDADSGVVDVTSRLQPITVYGGAKLATFGMLFSYFFQKNVEFAWARLFYLYGENDKPDRLIPYIRRQIATGQPCRLGKGSKIRDYLDVSVAGKMIVTLALGRKCGAFNICSGKGRTLRNIAETIANEFSRKDLLRFDVKNESEFDPPKLVGVPSDLK